MEVDNCTFNFVLIVYLCFLDFFRIRNIGCLISALKYHSSESPICLTALMEAFGYRLVQQSAST